MRDHTGNVFYSKEEHNHHTYPVYIIHHHQMSQPQRSEQLEHARQRCFLQTNPFFLNSLSSTKS